MVEQPSQLKRLSIGKTIGFVFGLAVFFVLPLAQPDVDILFRVGVLFWLTLMGAVIGLSGGVSNLPVFGFALSWWFRGIALGGSMFLMLWLVAHEKIDEIVASGLGSGSLFLNGPWVVLDGLILGLIMAGLIKMFGGEGRSPQAG